MRVPLFSDRTTHAQKKSCGQVNRGNIPGTGCTRYSLSLIHGDRLTNSAVPLSPIRKNGLPIRAEHRGRFAMVVSHTFSDLSRIVIIVIRIVKRGYLRRKLGLTPPKLSMLSHQRTHLNFSLPTLPQSHAAPNLKFAPHPHIEKIIDSSYSTPNHGPTQKSPQNSFPQPLHNNFNQYIPISNHISKKVIHNRKIHPHLTQ